MQLLACDLWLMEKSAVRNLEMLAWQLRATVEKWPEPRCAEQAIERVAASTAQAKRPRAVAVIPITGALEARPTELGAWMGMTSYEVVGKVFDHFMADETVSGVILDISSPGGMVYGAQELADKIYRARGTKPIISVANPMAASGAYWLAAAADRVVVTPSGDVGSVGVITEHVDMSRMYAESGVTVSTFRSAVSPYKGETSDAEPLNDEARKHIQARVDEISQVFVGELARFRNLSTGQVAEQFGKGRLVNANAAIRAGMADRIGTLDEIAMKLASGRIRIANERAQDDWNAKTRREQIKESAENIVAKIQQPATNAKE